VYQEYDENALRFTAGLDGVLAPVWLSIDCFDAYLSPAMSPDDVTAWLATWVGEAVISLCIAAWTVTRKVRRAAIPLAGDGEGHGRLDRGVHRLRPDIVDNGGVAVAGCAAEM
jgi:phage tail-like protein